MWQLQEAKNRFSEVVEQAQREGPQVVTKRGVATVVVLSYTDYRKLLLSKQKLCAFFRKSPLVGVELDLSRDPSSMRKDLMLLRSCSIPTSFRN